MQINDNYNNNHNDNNNNNTHNNNINIDYDYSYKSSNSVLKLNSWKRYLPFVTVIYISTTSYMYFFHKIPFMHVDF